MTYKHFERQCNDAPARSREEAEKQFNERLMGEAKFKAVAEKIADGKGETLAWSDLLSEFLSLGDQRIISALKRLSPKQLLTLEQTASECRETSKEAAIEKARLYMLELGISPADVVGVTGLDRPDCAEVRKAKKRPYSQRKWASAFRKELHQYYLKDNQRILEAPKDTVPLFIGRYPELTNSDVSKGKNYLQSNKGLPRAADLQ